MVGNFDKKIILETGEEFCGYGFGADESRVCEIVFNTSMVGYQEIISDPSYTYQAVVMSYPLIGNYGIADDDYESRTPSIGALVVREYNDQPSNFRYTKTLGEVLEEYRIPAISGVDTRRLMRIIRDRGTCRALITGMETSSEEGVKIISETPVPTDAISRISCDKRWYSRTSNHKFNVVAVDCGVRLSTVRSLNARGCNVTIVPHNTSFEAIDGMNPDGVLISNGPGNPEDAESVIELIRRLRGKYPVFGIDLGCQLIALAFGAKTEKMKFGHRGANHPVRNLETGLLEIVNQNHSYVVNADSIEGTGLKITHVNVLDNTAEGVSCDQERIFGVQYQPGNADGPRGSVNPLDKFVTMMKEGKNNA